MSNLQLRLMYRKSLREYLITCEDVAKKMDITTVLSQSIEFYFVFAVSSSFNNQSWNSHLGSVDQEPLLRKWMGFTQWGPNLSKFIRQSLQILIWEIPVASLD